MESEWLTVSGHAARMKCSIGAAKKRLEKLVADGVARRRWGEKQTLIFGNSRRDRRVLEYMVEKQK